MASTLSLDRSDPGIDKLVSGWEDGGEYEVTLKIRQTASSDNVGTYEVVSLESEDYTEPAEKPTKPAMKKEMPKMPMMEEGEA